MHERKSVMRHAWLLGLILIGASSGFAAPVYQGLYALDGTGIVRSVDTVPITIAGMSFGWDIAKDIELVGNETGTVTGMYLLSGYGDVFGLPESISDTLSYGTGLNPYFGWDIARDLEVAIDWTYQVNGRAGYYILDGFGGVFHVGDTSRPYFKIYRNALTIDRGQDIYLYWGWDVGVDLEVTVTQTETPRVNGYYVLDKYGGVHWNIENDAGVVLKAPWATGIYPLPQPYFGWDIARDFEVNRSARGYHLLDGYGGIHSVGDAVDARVLNGGAATPYFFGMDIFEDIETVWNETPAIDGIVMLDCYGMLYEVGNVGIQGTLPPLDQQGVPWDIYKDIEISPFYTFITEALVSGP